MMKLSKQGTYTRLRRYYTFVIAIAIDRLWRSTSRSADTPAVRVLRTLLK